MKQFKVGDRVEAVVDHPKRNSDLYSGDTGTVCYVSESSRRIGVEWDKEISGGHPCDGHCKKGHGWFVFDQDICLYEETKEIDEDSFLKLLSV